MLDLIAPWADQLVALMQLVFVPALIPTIWAGRKGQAVPLTTSVPTALALGGIGLAMASLGLFYATFMSFAVAAAWATIAGQRLRRKA